MEWRQATDGAFQRIDVPAPSSCVASVVVGEKAAALSRPRPVVKGVQRAIAGENVFEVAFLEGCSQALFTVSLEHVPACFQVIKRLLVGLHVNAIVSIPRCDSRIHNSGSPTLSRAARMALILLSLNFALPLKHCLVAIVP